MPVDPTLPLDSNEFSYPNPDGPAMISYSIKLDFLAKKRLMARREMQEEASTTNFRSMFVMECKLQ